MTLAGYSIIAFIVIFLLCASAGLLLVLRERRPKQVAGTITPFEEKQTLTNKIQLATVSLGEQVGRLESVVPKSQAEVGVLRQRLIRAGYRKDSAVKIFYGAKVVAISFLLLLVVVTGLVAQSPFFVLILAAAFGFIGPDFWLGNRIKTRQKRINLGLPDVLDLLIVCVEAGLSLDQATARTAEEMSKSASDIADELSVVVLEQRAGLPRSEAWKHFADRTDVKSVRNVVSMLVQSEQFGTSVAKTLRVHSESLRTKRIQEVEENAAKATIKMLFPLVFFIFPSIFVVTLGPSVILMIETYNKTFNH